jgi:hypothetical protein
VLKLFLFFSVIIKITVFKNIMTFILIGTNISKNPFASTFMVTGRSNVGRLGVSRTARLAHHLQNHKTSHV